MSLKGRQSIIEETHRLSEATEQPVPEGWGPYEYLHSCHKIDRLRKLLSQETALSDFVQRRSIYIANGGVGMSLHQLDRWLIERASVTSANGAVDELMAFLSSDHIDCTFIYGLIGVRVENPVPILWGISLVPFHQSQLRRQSDDSWAPTARTTAALALPMKHPKLIGGREMQQRSLVIYKEVLSRFETVRLCLGLAKPSPSEVAVETYLIPDANPAVRSGATSRVRYNAGWIDPVSHDEEDGTLAARITERLITCPEALRDRVMIVLHRFQQGMQKIPTVDSSIDLGIVLEALFVPDGGTELSYRLKMRAAKLLGTDVEQRTTIAKQIGRIYGLRSRAVHTGRLPERVKLEGFESVESVLRHGYALAARATIEVLERRIENWDELMLS